jgi:hypothetical protein
MITRSDLAFGLVAAVSLVATFGVAFVGQGTELAFLALFPIFAYVSYWAFSIRQTLNEGLFRNQALGIGLVALGAYTLLISTAVFNDAPIIAGVTTFFWIDASVLAARRSDPRWRNTFHWTGVRIPVWILIMIGLVAFSTQTLFPNEGSQITFAGGQAVLFSAVGPFIIGAMMLPIVARRSKDMSFRHHLGWFGRYAALLFFLFVNLFIGLFLMSGSVQNDYLIVSQTLILTGAGYCLYRSAKSLVPLSVISPIGPAKKINQSEGKTQGRKPS